jgi:hypothetical protein
MAEISLSNEELDQAKSFLVQYLRDAGYDGSLEDGTALYDLLINGMSLLYILINKDVDKAAAYQSIDKALASADLLGDELDTIIDSILSNWFVERKGGTKTTGKLRLVFSKPIELFTANANTVLAKINTQEFVPTKDEAFTTSDFVAVINSVGTGLEYYVDIFVTSVNISDEEIPVGTKVDPYISNIYFLRADVVEAFTPGILQESNEDFIQRTEAAITTRELISERAIQTVLQDTFDGVDSVYVAGYGDPEQLRDYIEFEHVKVHVGNKTDIYIGCNLIELETFVTTDEANTVQIGTGYVSDVLRVTYIDEETESEIETPFTYRYVAEGEFGSERVSPRLYLPEIAAGKEVKVAYLGNQIIEEVSNFVKDREQRVACYDPFIKAKYPVIIKMNFTAELSSQEIEHAQAIQEIQQEVVKFVKNVPANSRLVVSELFHSLHSNIDYLSKIQLPVDIHYQVTDPKTLAPITGTFTTEFQLPDSIQYEGDLSPITDEDGHTLFPCRPEESPVMTFNGAYTFSGYNPYDLPEPCNMTLSKQLTWNTIQYYTNPDFIQISVVS